MLAPILRAIGSVAKMAGKSAAEWGGSWKNMGSIASNAVTGKGMGTGGYALTKAFGQKGGFMAGGMLKGAVVGGGLGAGMSLLTGNSDWMAMGAGIGAFKGGASRHLAQRAYFGGKVSKSLTALTGSRAMAGVGIGAVAGAMNDNPNYAIYGGLAAGAAPWVFKNFASPKGFGTLAKGMLQAPFSPNAAMRTLSRISSRQAFASPLLPGAFIGLGFATFKGATGIGQSKTNSVTSGYFPGGVTQLSNGGSGIGNNHLSTEGLTLALHKNAHGNRVV